jgi:hypothetical protein
LSIGGHGTPTNYLHRETFIVNIFIGSRENINLLNKLLWGTAGSLQHPVGYPQRIRGGIVFRKDNVSTTPSEDYYHLVFVGITTARDFACSLSPFDNSRSVVGQQSRRLSIPEFKLL